MIKRYKVGTVQKKKDGNGKTVAVGAKSKDPRFVTNIEIIVKDADGKVLARAENGYLQVVDPRKAKGITEERAARIPDWISSELFLVVEE